MPACARAGNKSHKYVEEYEASDNELHRTKAGLMDVAEVAYATRNKRSVWTVSTSPFRDAHFATFPPRLVEPMVLAGCPPGGTVLDPFGGAGTVALVASRNRRQSVLIEAKEDYAQIAARRLTYEWSGPEGRRRRDMAKKQQTVAALPLFNNGDSHGEEETTAR